MRTEMEGEKPVECPSGPVFMLCGLRLASGGRRETTGEYPFFAGSSVFVHTVYDSRSDIHAMRGLRGHA